MLEGGDENLSVKQTLTLLLAVSVDSVNKVEVGQLSPRLLCSLA